MTRLYRQLLKKAWYITRKFKYLWPLGIFVAFLGNGSEYQVLFKQTANVNLQPDTVAVWKENLNAILPALNFSGGRVFSASISLVFGLAVLILLLWLIISSLGGLIKGAAAADKEERYKFSMLIKEGHKKFWPILGLNIIAKVIVYGILILILTPLMLATFAQGNQSANLLVILLTFLIFIPLTVIVSLATKYASAGVVLNNEKMWPAFKNGWRMFSANWLISLEMALVIFIINLLVGLAFVLLSVILFAPFFFFGVVYTISSPSLFSVLIYISITLLLIASVFVGSGLAVFQTSSWTLLYLKLASGAKVYSKIVRWVAMMPSKFKKREIE